MATIRRLREGTSTRTQDQVIPWLSDPNWPWPFSPREELENNGRTDSALSASSEGTRRGDPRPPRQVTYPRIPELYYG